MVTLYFVGLKDKAYMDGRIGKSNQVRMNATSPTGLWFHFFWDNITKYRTSQNISRSTWVFRVQMVNWYIEESFQRTAAAVLKLVYHFIWDQVKLFSQWVTMTISGTVREQFNWKPLVLEEVQTFHTFLHLNIQY